MKQLFTYVFKILKLQEIRKSSKIILPQKFPNIWYVCNTVLLALMAIFRALCCQLMLSMLYLEPTSQSMTFKMCYLNVAIGS